MATKKSSNRTKKSVAETPMKANKIQTMPTKSKIQDQTFLFTGTLTEFIRDEAEAALFMIGYDISNYK